MRRAIYPGTFDPITIGHLDIALRASKMFDEVVIAVAKSSSKSPMFSFDDRLEFVKASIKEYPNIKVVGFDKLLVELANELEANIIIRGLRAVSDFEYELQMGYANASLKPDIETIYLMPNLKYAFISSSIVRAILNFNGDVSHLLPKEVCSLIKGLK